MLFRFRSSTQNICQTELGALTQGIDFVPPISIGLKVTSTSITYVLSPLIHDYVDAADSPRADDPDMFTSQYVDRYGDPRGVVFPFMCLDQPAIYYLLIDSNSYPGMQLDPSPFFEQDNNYRVLVHELLEQLPGGYRQDRVAALNEFVLDTDETQFFDDPRIHSKMDGARPSRFGRQPEDKPKYDSHVGFEISQHWHTTPIILTVSTMDWGFIDIDLDDGDGPEVETRVVNTIICLKRPLLNFWDLASIFPQPDAAHEWYNLDNAGSYDGWSTWSSGDQHWLVEQIVGQQLPYQFFNQRVDEGEELSATLAGSMAYNHHQEHVDTDDVWTIVHNLGTNNYSFEATDIDGNRIEPISISKPNTNTLVLTFATEQWGRCHVGISNELDILYLDRTDVDILSDSTTSEEFFAMAFLSSHYNAIQPSQIGEFQSRFHFDEGRNFDDGSFLELPLIPAGPNTGQEWLESQVVGVTLPNWFVNATVSPIESGVLDVTQSLDMMMSSVVEITP